MAEKTVNNTPPNDPSAVPLLPIETPGKDVDMPVYTLLDAMMDTATVMMELMEDTTNSITQMMALSNNLIGPDMQAWQQAYQKILKDDADAIDPDHPDQGMAHFNTDNATASAANSSFGNVSSMISQQISTQTSNYQNQQQMAQTLAVGLTQSISQDWVI